MAYRGGFNASSCQEAAMAPRTHARAALRDRITSASYFGLRILTTVPARSIASNVSMTVATNSRCFFGDRHSMCARRTTLNSVSSTDGGGISASIDGDRLARSGIMLTPQAPRPAGLMRSGNGGACKAQLLQPREFFSGVGNPTLLPKTQRPSLSPSGALRVRLACSSPRQASRTTPFSLSEIAHGPLH